MLNVNILVLGSKEGLCITATTITEKLMPILQICQVDRSHLYFLKKILAEKTYGSQSISMYSRCIFEIIKRSN